MKIPIHEINNTCKQWMIENNFTDKLFEDTDKNEVCNIINRLVVSNWDNDTLVIESYKNRELTKDQFNFINYLCEKHDLIYGRTNGWHYITTQIDIF